MSDQLKEPSQWASDAAMRIGNTPFLRAIDSTLPTWGQIIQQAIDAATAEQQKEIAELKSRLNGAEEAKLAVISRTRGQEEEIERLKAQGHDEFREQNNCIRRLREHIAAMESLLEQAVKVLALYVNVPESVDVRSQWDKLKNS